MSFPVANIRSACKSRGITLAQLEREMGFGNGVIARWEYQKNSPPIDRIIDIANFFGITVDQLIGKDTKKAPSISDEASKIARRIAALDESKLGAVDALVSYYEKQAVPTSPPAKLIPLFGQSMAAGDGEPDMGAAFFDEYEVPSDSKAEFACRVHGDSLEPYYADGSIALAVKRQPEVGEVGAFLVDGEYKLKQFVDDGYGNVYLFALNRDRSDTDQTLGAREEHSLYCLGTLLMDRRPPMPK